MQLFKLHTQTAMKESCGNISWVLQAWVHTPINSEHQQVVYHDEHRLDIIYEWNFDKVHTLLALQHDNNISLSYESAVYYHYSHGCLASIKQLQCYFYPVWKLWTAAFFLFTTNAAMRTIRTSSMMMTISAPPTDPPITEAETWEDLALSVEGSGMGAWLHLCQ